MFMSPDELSLVHVDFANLLNSPESTPVTLSYKIYDELADAALDPAFDIADDRPLSSGNIEYPTHAIQKILTVRDVSILQYGILEIGDAIFYFDPYLDLTSPRPEKPVAQGTLRVIDPNGTAWLPRRDAQDRGESLRHQLTMLGESQISQVLFCSLEA